MTNPMPTTPEDTDAPAGVSRRLGHFAAWAGGIVLVLSTLYLAAMAVLWSGQANELTATRLDLANDLAQKETALEDALAEVEVARSGLEETLDDLSELANDKAQAQDYRFLLKDVAIAMDDCANEAELLLGYVYNRDMYYAWSLLDYEDGVRDYFRDISQALTDIVAEIEEAVS